MNRQRVFVVIVFVGLVIFAGFALLIGWSCYVASNDDYRAAKRAVANDEHEILKSLINKIDLDRQTMHSNPCIDNRTLLHVAVENKAAKSVSLLLSAGADPDLRNGLGETPLAIAVLQHKPNSETREIVNSLISKGALVDTESLRGNTLLHLIAIHGYSSEYCPILVANGVDIDAKNKAGDTALHTAVYRKNLAVVETLLSLNADASIENRDGRGPISLARELKFVDILKVFDEQTKMNKTKGPGTEKENDTVKTEVKLPE